MMEQALRDAGFTGVEMVEGVIYARSNPVLPEFTATQTADGWQLALQRMRAGDKWIIYIPYTMGYGTRASGPIPAFSTLVFEVELLGVA